MPELSYREAVRDALARALRQDDDVFVMGEDIAEMGGSFGATAGLLEEFGPERVRNTPISEMAIVGAGVGAAAQGMRPVVEIMYQDFTTLASQQIVNQAAKHRTMSGGQMSIPLVVRTQDPVEKLRASLEIPDEEWNELEREIAEVVDGSVEFAKNGTDPKPEDALKNVYAE